MVNADLFAFSFHPRIVIGAFVHRRKGQEDDALILVRTALFGPIFIGAFKSYLNFECGMLQRDVLECVPDSVGTACGSDACGHA
jgi:hypothetical protein